MADIGVGTKTYFELRTAIAPELPGYLLQQRWFGGKARKINSVEVVDVIPLPTKTAKGFVLIVSVKYADGAHEMYAMPFVQAEATSELDTEAGALKFQTADGTSVILTDGLKNEEFLTAILDLIQQATIVKGEKGEIRGVQTTVYSKLSPTSSSDLRPRPVGAEQSNTSIIYGDRLILKFFRRIQEGINPDIEIGKFLTEKTSFTSVPPLAGLLEYHTRDGKQMAQGMLQSFVPNQGDAWTFTLRSLTAFYEIAVEQAGNPSAIGEISESMRTVIDPYLVAAELLAQRTAEMHLALSSEPRDPDFVPEPFTMESQRALQESITSLLKRVFASLRDKITALPLEWQSNATALARREQEIVGRFHASLGKPIRAMRTRIHGDYHLGQVLRTATDFVIIDFEGEPARPIAERRIKRSPLQDVAGMLRSFHYAAFARVLGEDKMKNLDTQRMGLWGQSWNTWVANRFLAKYFETAGAAPYLPKTQEEVRSVLEIHLLEKAIYELGYELNNRPAWVGIPLQGILTILATT